MAKLPSIQWYPGDWKKDPGIRALDYFSRGVWFEMLMLMHESEPRGYLTLNGHPMTDEMIAQALGLDNQILTTTLTKLLTYGVACREPGGGAVFSRRMVRDEEIRKMRQKAGKLGGNPVLLNQNTTTEVKQIPTPSSSSSSSEVHTSEKISDPPPSRKKYSFEIAHLNFAKFMFEKIREIAPSAKEPNFEAWADCIRKLNKIDRIEGKRIKQLFEWANHHEFWGSVILSPANLREKWAQIEAQMMRDSGHGSKEQKVFITKDTFS